jgi:hypothetical protein
VLLDYTTILTLKYNEVLTLCNQLGQRALEMATKGGHDAVAKVLRDRGADTRPTKKPRHEGRK